MSQNKKSTRVAQSKHVPSTEFSRCGLELSSDFFPLDIEFQVIALREQISFSHAFEYDCLYANCTGSMPIAGTIMLGQ